MKRKFLIFYGLVAILGSCNLRQNNSSTRDKNAPVELVAEMNTDDSLSVEIVSESNCCTNTENIPTELLNEASASEISAMKVVSDFYNWYIKEELKEYTTYIASAPYKLYDSSIYGLDLDVVKSDLSTFIYFSDNFKQEIIRQNERCNEFILSLKKNDREELIYIDSDLCDYLYTNRWLGYQDYFWVVDFRITNIELKDDTSYDVFIETLTEDGVHTRIRVSVDGDYKIDGVELVQ